ncbi:uncharacterized protein BCR38DRAFT_435334 [Pseudomassariella vexata]|uniref:Uncharacterized protein n=1 Tax=Pseudomassariella vexata TaxID=1141098 RepID=A0A1Y2DYZ2_9PEZI|nr:uncharacterized protein BCR38DRAFT_435334 [Pseudomassariella vexata]ORY64512.1 hypothetical protein BCR38DRAFT_435334 [Pseudomassariella vexata]
MPTVSACACGRIPATPLPSSWVRKSEKGVEQEEQRDSYQIVTIWRRRTPLSLIEDRKPTGQRLGTKPPSLLLCRRRRKAVFCLIMQVKKIIFLLPYPTNGSSSWNCSGCPEVSKIEFGRMGALLRLEDWAKVGSRGEGEVGFVNFDRPCKPLFDNLFAHDDVGILLGICQSWIVQIINIADYWGHDVRACGDIDHFAF